MKRNYFSDFKLVPFATFSDYKTAFKKDFWVIESNRVMKLLEHTDPEFRQFLISWLPEIRHLKAQINDPKQCSEIIDAYLDKLLSLIPDEKSGAAVMKGKPNKIYFSQCYTIFFAVKRNAAKRNTASQQKQQQKQDSALFAKSRL